MEARLLPETKRRPGVIIPETRRWPLWTLTLVQLGLVAALLAGWQAGVAAHVIDPFFWSSPLLILHSGLIFFSKGSAFYDTWFTFSATIVGFVAGSALGAAIGLALWWSVNAAAIVEPYIVVINAVPKLAFAPLIILIFGIGIGSKIVLAIALTFVVTALAAYAGVRAVDADLVRLAYSLGGRRWNVFVSVIVPSALPWIVSSLRINVGLALAGTIVGEFVSSRYGLGKMIMYAGSTYDMGLIWVGIIVLSALSMVLYYAVLWLERTLLRGMHVDRPGR
jgi:NitT/TauT family transport system permease protein